MQLWLSASVSLAMEGEEVNSSFAVAVNATTDNSYSLQAYQTAIFIVVLLGEFLASLVGNVILIAMIIKTRKFQNTINIFLTGFEVSYLCSMLMMITTITTLANNEWMFGNLVCLLQKQILAVIALATPIVHLFLSREILSMALAPCEYKTNIKRVILNIVFTWMITVASLSITEALYFETVGDNDLNLCTPFIITNSEKEAIILAYCLIVTVGIAVVLGFTLRNYYKVICPEPRETTNSSNGLLSETDNMEFDKERVKAILPAFVIQCACTIAACVWGNFIILYDIIVGIDEESRPLFECPYICIAVLPAVSPVIFIFSSPKYRKHVSELCPCFVRPLRVYTNVALQYRIPVATRSNRIYQSKARPKMTTSHDRFDDTSLEQIEMDAELDTVRYWPNAVEPKSAWSDKN